ncbi:MAG TPA: YidC/Oxa1 family insertase periplasmic-domain containing protein, partial [Niastella sp.]|nr:YidC/Oxa1 family insertase periplasmic-domain containing protein [Niastella sp.]
WVELKNFKAPDSANVKLAATDFDKITYTVNTGQNKTAGVTSFYFTGGQVATANGANTISYQLQSPDGSSIVHQFVLKPGKYMVDFTITINGVPQLLTGNTLNLTWQNKALQLQKDLAYEKQQSHIAYSVAGDYNDASALSSNTETFDEPVNWIGIKQQFFNTTLLAKNNFTSGNIAWTVPADEHNRTLVEAVAHLNIALPAGANSATIPLAFYYGPTDYKILKQFDNGMSNMVNLGSGIFSFVKYLNYWIILPVFDLFSKFTTNFGIVILLLTLFIRLIISPLSYTSYLSGAKMKVLRPEIDKLKAKYGTDQQQISMEQMKLFREAGVNPLGGCIPALLQIPIFFALYSFFNSNVALRGQKFLWANDLSQYDSIFNFGHVPILS